MTTDEAKKWAHDLMTKLLRVSPETIEVRGVFNGHRHNLHVHFMTTIRDLNLMPILNEFKPLHQFYFAYYDVKKLGMCFEGEVNGSVVGLTIPMNFVREEL